jgi:hypothetical protein
MKFNAKLFKEAWVRTRRFASKDLERAPITGIHVEVYEEAGLFAVATDSYSLVETWLPCIDPTKERPDTAKVTGDFIINVFDPANGFIAPCSTANADDTVELALVGENTITLRSHHRDAPITSMLHAFSDTRDWPSFRSLWPTADAVPTPVFGVNPSLMARMSQTFAPYGKYDTDPMRMHVTDHLKPIVFDKPVDFPHRALLMPIRLHGAV